MAKRGCCCARCSATGCCLSTLDAIAGVNGRLLHSATDPERSNALTLQFPSSPPPLPPSRLFKIL